MDVIKKNLLAKSSVKKVLIVDDDLDMADAIKYIVESLNPEYKCTIVNDPYEALLDLADQKYDLVLMDQNIPGLYGSEILEKADHIIDMDTGMLPLKREAQPIDVVMISNSEDKLNLHLNFKNFKVTDFIIKKDLTRFLRQRLLKGAS